MTFNTGRRFISWGSLWRARKSKSSEGSLQEVDSVSSRQKLLDQLQSPAASRGSIFSDELDSVGPGAPVEPKSNLSTHESLAMGGSLLREHLVRAVDPDPLSRVRWQRKVVMRQVRQNLDVYAREETRSQRISRTERRLHSQSSALPTSTKKLVHLARQIAGKTVEDALVQMRFSKKKMAREIRWQLTEARDVAIVQRGMGLGRVNGEVVAEGDGAKIQTKDGKWMTVHDPTRLYVEQAWVGKGPNRFKSKSYRARGRLDILVSPTAYINFVIKEEKTRIREHQDREDRRARRPPWVQLPDRPVTAQRQHYSW